MAGPGNSGGEEAGAGRTCLSAVSGSEAPRAAAGHLVLPARLCCIKDQKTLGVVSQAKRSRRAVNGWNSALGLFLTNWICRSLIVALALVGF